MKRDQFLRELAGLAKYRGMILVVDRQGGKGSHYKVWIGARASIVQSGEITPLLALKIKRQLGLI